MCNKPMQTIILSNPNNVINSRAVTKRTWNIKTVTKGAQGLFLHRGHIWIDMHFIGRRLRLFQGLLDYLEKPFKVEKIIRYILILLMVI